MPKNLKEEYRQVRFRCSQVDVPLNFFVITAYNPDGVTIDGLSNKEANQSLLADSLALEFHPFPITGGSADFSHAEPGFGLECSRQQALDLARKYRQDAVFEIRGGQVFLISALADPEPDEEIGKWTELRGTKI